MHARYWSWLAGAAIASSIGLLAATVALDAPTSLAQPSQALRGDWQLVGWGNPDDLTPLVSGTEITATFDGTRLSGSASCNQYTTMYEADGATLSVGPVAATRRACREPILAQETQFLGALSNAETYERTASDELQIHYQLPSGSGVLVFVPQAIPGLG